LPVLGPSPRLVSSPSLRGMIPAMAILAIGWRTGRATCFENAPERILVDSGIMRVSPAP
jgi:hypothetical protein